LVEPEHPQLSVLRQCELLGLPRASYYYRPEHQGNGESDENLFFMRLLDEQFTKTPFYGVEKMTFWLRTQGHMVNSKRVRRLLRKMGLEAIYPKPNLSKANPEHKIYPYLLRGVKIERINQVWSCDITYVRLAKGFIYLIAVIDWHSRYVLSWEISTTMEVDFCSAALERALAQGKPEIFNTDQGSQFTSLEFTGKLAAAQVKISMDGKGRALDNIFVERLWRTVKVEEVYPKDYATVSVAAESLAKYFEFYNGVRYHQALEYQTPAAVYFKNEA